MSTPTDTRINTLTDEVLRLRNCHSEADTQLNSLLLKLTEIQLNLATQDRTLSKLDCAVNGNGKPGLIGRVDQIEHITGGLLKAVWLLTAAVATAAVRMVVDKMR